MWIDFAAEAFWRSEKLAEAIFQLLRLRLRMVRSWAKSNLQRAKVYSLNVLHASHQARAPPG
jgi:hypothetical protein